jgi:tyrosine-protein kinase Etk/Wzc
MRESSRASELHVGGSTLEGNAFPIEAATKTGSEVDTLDVLLVLSSRKRMIVSVTIAAAVLAAIVSLLLPKTYTATTTILPPEQSQSAVSALFGQIGLLSGLSSSDFTGKDSSDLFVAMLKSRTIQDALVNRFDLRREYWVKDYQDARKKLNSRSDIVSNPDSSLISISVSDHDPRRAAAMANAYVEQLRSLNQNLAVSEASQRRLFYEQKLDAERESLSEAELALKQAEERTGLLQPDAQGRAIIDAVAHARAQVGIKEVQVEAMRSYATPNNPDLQRAERELAGLRAQLASLERSSGQLGNGNLEIPTRRLPAVELDYIRRARDMKYHEALYEFLTKQLEAARIDEAKEAIVVQVVDKAVVPEKKSGPHRLLITLITALLVFCGCCLWVLMAEALARKQQDPNQRARLALLRHSLKWNS